MKKEILLKIVATVLLIVASLGFMFALLDIFRANSPDRILRSKESKVVYFPVALAAWIIWIIWKQDETVE
jgi:hypothetical protein